MVLVDINTASKDELAKVTGLRSTLAGAIVDYREAHGPFSGVDDLLLVDGITRDLFDKIRDHLTAISPTGGAIAVTVRRRDPQSSGDYVGHRTDVAGTYTTGEPRDRVPFITAAGLAADGTATLEVPVRSSLEGAVTIRAIAPDGSVLAALTHAGINLPREVTLTTDPKVFGQTLPNTDPAAGRPTRLRGSVVDAAGQQAAGNLQVVIWGADAANPQDADFHALIVANTDGQGHFTGPYPVGVFTAAHATVGLPDGPAPVAIHLEDSAMPETVILVLDLPDVHGPDADCACKDGADAPRNPDSRDLGRADGTFSTDAGAGRCVDFTKPDRTLEEYSFSYVVRTTEPQIRGFTLDEPRRVPASVVGTYLPGLLTQTASTSITDAVTRPTVQQPSPVPLSFRASAVTVADSAPMAAETISPAAAQMPVLEGNFDAQVLRSLSRDPATFTVDTIATAARLSLHSDLIRYLGRAIAREPGRQALTGQNPVDWDDDPTVYQATTIAHGHLLRFKQEWVADGYSMGNLLYSLPLAPGQKKQMAVVDWERRETASRDEFRSSRDTLEAMVDRDRDVSEIVSGTLSESTRGGSSASTGSFAAGLGIGAIIGPVGGLLGVGGGTSSADSSAWQDSSRSTAANALNQLRDRTIQSAASVRTQRTSVVSTVSQGERVSATTESVANYNHCHAITIQYFEVLRHLLVRQRLVDVQECLFIPMLMSWFTRDKALRWRNTLADTVPIRLRGGFPALERIDANYVGSDLPVGRYADDNLESVDGELTLRFQLARPADQDDKFDAAAWNPLLTLFGFSPQDFYNQFLAKEQFKDRVFLQQLGPKIASALIQFLRVDAIRTNETAVSLNIDPTLLTTFANDRMLSVTLRMAGALPAIRRSDIKAVRISATLALPGFPFIGDVLPTGSRVIVEGGSLRYSTAHMSDALFSNAYIRNDLTGYDDVRIETPLNRQELRNPREEDKEISRNLLDHLNENIERYHHVIWGRMSDARRYMLLDGFEAPNAAGRSVASVVENELVGIVGNSLVMPVARGFHLDPTYRQDIERPVDLLDHYQPNTPIEPSRIAMPTRGVYAEAVMGACNSCEVIDETRFWRWSEEPIPDSPTQLLPVSTDSRQSAPLDTRPTDFPAPIIAMQSAPAAPDPTGVGAAFSLLGQSGAFRDITGLDANQKNAAAALQEAFQTATTFGTKAADLALQGKMTKDIDKAMKTIQSAKSQGLIDDAQAAGLTETAIRGLVGAGATNPKEASTTDDVEKITKTAGAEQASVSVTRPTGEKIDVDARPTGKEDTSKPIIILTDDTALADTRAFHPSKNDKSLVIEVEASFRNAPAGATLRWSAPATGAITIDNPTAARTRVRGITPGKQDLDVELLDSGGTRIASSKVRLSVPQCIRLTETVALFDAALLDAQLDGQKDDVVSTVKGTVENLLAKANVRVFWQVGSLNEALPAHVPATNVVVATLQNKDPNGNLGVTTSAGAADTFNETITLFPGMYSEPDAIDVDTETQALIIQLATSLPGSPALLTIATKVYGRLIGETAAHEIGHALLWDDIPGSGHNNPAIVNDLMNQGVDRPFRQRTGMENTAQVSPVLPEHYVDHGVASIGHFQAANQALIDGQWPVPPAFG